MRIVNFDGLAEGFAISHLRRTDIGLDLEFALHAVNQNVEVKLAHSLDDRLARFMIGRNAERRIFGGQAMQGNAHLFLVGLGLRFHAELDNRLGEFHAFQDDRIAGVAQRIACRGGFHTRQSNDVAGKGLFNVLAVIGVHFQDTSDFFLLVLHRVEQCALLQLAGIDAAEGQRTHERIVHHLEGESRKWRVIGRWPAVFGFAVEQNALDGGNVERARHIVDNRVEQRLDALVLERRAAQYRNEALVQRTLADQRLQGRCVGLVAFEILFHHVIVLLDSKLDQLFAIFSRFVGHILRDFTISIFGTQIFVLPGDRTLVHQIDETDQARFNADRQIENRWGRAETIDDRLYAEFEIRAGAVELVDEAHPRHFIFVSLAPNGFGLRLNAGNAIETGNRAIEHTQRTLNFNGEVNMAWRINDIDPVLGTLAVIGIPETGRRSRGNGNTPLLLLLHPVHRRRAIMHFADFIGLAGIIQDTFRSGRLAGINMGHDADIAVIFERMAACHSLYSDMWGTKFWLPYSEMG